MEHSEPNTRVQEWTHVDKSAWPRGPWDHEPDKRRWVDAASNLDCLMVRNPDSGNWCGYVGVPETHRWYGKGYSECTGDVPCDARYCGHGLDAVLDVHGGLTFAERCHEPTRAQYDALAAAMTPLLPEAARYPQGDAARRVAALRAQQTLSFDAWCADQQSKRICHIPLPGRPAEVFWFGFDCAHLHDLSPGYVALRGSVSYGDEWYKDTRYVERECTRLAAQLAAVPSKADDA